MATTSSPYIPLINGSGSVLVHGEIVRVSGVNTVSRAQADSGSHLTGLAGVNGSGSIGVGGSANIFTTGAQADVLLETGLTPVAGQTVYVSATVAGRGTTVSPGTAVAIGTIENVTQYATLKLVQVALAIGAGGSVDTQPKNGANLTDGDQTLQPVTDQASRYKQVTALTANRTKTLGVAGVFLGMTVYIQREDSAAFTLTIVNGGGGVVVGMPFVFAASPTEKQLAAFQSNGTDWAFIGFYYVV